MRPHVFRLLIAITIFAGFQMSHAFADDRTPSFIRWEKGDGPTTGTFETSSNAAVAAAVGTAWVGGTHNGNELAAYEWNEGDSQWTKIASCQSGFADGRSEPGLLVFVARTNHRYKLSQTAPTNASARVSIEFLKLK